MPNTFPTAFRLRESYEFRPVFYSKRKCRTSEFTIHFIANQLGYARLGIIIAKKQVKTAVKRNWVKRRIREGFRLWHDGLKNHDIVIVVHHAVSKLTSKELQQRLEKQWRVIAA